MARPSECSTLAYLTNQQINDKIDNRKILIYNRFLKSENLYRKDLLSHFGCVNAIEFSNQGDLLVSGGDDRRVLLWRVEQAIQSMAEPTEMKAQHISNIFCLGYDNSKTKIFSGGNDDQVIVHDLRTSDVLNFFLHEKPVYGLSIHPYNDNVFTSACDDGRVLIYDIRVSSATETFCLAQYKTAFHSVMFNPVEPRLLATANAKEGISMWDIRKPLEPFLRYGNETPMQSCMNARFNSMGNQLLALRRRLPPILYNIDSPATLCEFDHPGYYNSCTMKSCCFAGENDEYVLSGSDDFNLYMWKIPTTDRKWIDTAHMVLRGHRSIVNQVRYNPASCIFATSGVEKIIKIWSPFPLGCESLGGLQRDAGKRERQRRVFTQDEYIRLVIRSGQFMTHDYSQQSTKEDPRMMAFFDSLVQREVEGWSSEEMPTGPQSPSESEMNPLTREPLNATDFDESTASEGGVVPERPLESPIRISRLIASLREKLFWSSITNGNNTILKLSNTARQSASGSDSDEDGARVKRKSKSKSKLVREIEIVKKRKYPKISRKKNRAKKKRNVLKINNGSVSNEEPIDATQPSTSSGVISRRSRYIAMENDAKLLSSSSSSSEDNDLYEKVNHSKTDSDTSVETYIRKHRKFKNISRHEFSKKQDKQQKTDNDREDEKTDRKNCVNGSSTSKIQEDGFSTPPKLSQVSDTSDSGVLSGISTVEKSSGQVRNEQNDTDSSDHEQKLKNLEYFKKKVDVVRRSYHTRSTSLPQTISTTTDSSD